MIAAYCLGRIAPAAAVPELARSMRSDWAPVRWQSAWALTRIGAAALPALLEAIEDRPAQCALVALGGTSLPVLLDLAGDDKTCWNPKRMRAVIRVLRAMAPERHERIVRALAANLGSRWKSVREEVMLGLADFGEYARPALDAGLREKRVTLRLAALATLAHGLPGTATAETAFRTLTDSSDTVQRYAAEAIGHLVARDRELRPRGRRLLEAACRDGGLLLRISALLGLATMRRDGEPAPAIVRELAFDPSWQVAVAAMRCLSAADGRDVAPRLLKLLGGRTRPQARLAVLQALARFEARGPLAHRIAASLAAAWPRLTGGGDRFAILEVCASLGPDAESTLPLLLSELDDARSGLRWKVLETLRALGPAGEPAVPRVLELLGSSRLRVAAARVLADLGRSVPAAERLLADFDSEDDDGIVTAAGAMAVLELEGELAARARNVLATTLADVGEYRVQRALVGALGSLADVATLIETLGHGNESVRWEAANALRRLGGRAHRALPALEKMSRDDTEDWVRREAGRAVREIRSTRR